VKTANDKCKLQERKKIVQADEIPKIK